MYYPDDFSRLTWPPLIEPLPASCAHLATNASISAAA